MPSRVQARLPSGAACQKQTLTDVGEPGLGSSK